MKNEMISDKQGLALFVLFIVGTSAIQGTGFAAKKDVWFAILLAIVISLPIVFIYARLHSLFPNKNLFDIIEICFGKFFGKIIIIILLIYVFDSIAQIIRNYGQFSETVILSGTPKIIIELLLMLLCIWAAKKGIEVLGRWALFFVTPITIILLIFIILLIDKMEINNIRPFFYEGMKPVVIGTVEAFMFPFTQTVVFTMFFSYLRTKKSPYKIYIPGLLIGGIILFLILLTATLVLGINEASYLYYPVYDTIARIDIADFLQRLEIVAGSIFITGVFIKVSVFLMATCQGAAKIFNLKDYRSVVTPIGLLAINLSYFEYESMFEYFDFITVEWYFYAFPFQVLFPILILITAEIKKKHMGKTVNE